MGQKTVTFNIIEDLSSITVHVKKPHMKYIEKFLKLDCAIDILKLKLFHCNNMSKEITESMAIYNAVTRQRPRLDLADKNTILISIGDGSSPRTAGLFAFLTKWICVSIDPGLNISKNWSEINRLHLIEKKAKDSIATLHSLFVERSKSNLQNNVIVVLPHAHVKSQEIHEVLYCINSNGTLLKIVSMPCCEPYNIEQRQMFGKDPDIVDFDWGCFSPEREIRTWNFIHYTNEDND